MDYIQNIIPNMLSGLGISAQIFALTYVLAFPLGILLALCRLSKVGPLGRVTEFYIYVMRGTPLMLQILFIYYGLPMLPGISIQMNDFSAAILAFVANYAAYFAEIFRGGIQSIPIGQHEAAKILGYSRMQKFLRIITPQMIKRVLPAVTNESITLVKDTSLAFAISYIELFTETQMIAASETSMLPYLAAAIFYYVFNLVVAGLMSLLEKKLNYYKI